MLSDLTISYADRSVTLPGIYLLIGILIVLGLAGFVVALRSTRRIEKKTTDATEILLVQLERIGDALDRIVNHTVARVGNESVKRPERAVSGRSASERAVLERATAERLVSGRTFTQRVVQEGSALERAAQKSAGEMAAASVPLTSDEATVEAGTAAAQEEQPVEVAQAEKSNLSEPARTLLYNMLGRS